MTSMAEKSPEKDEVKIVDVRRRIGYTIDSIANATYRQLQYIAKSCGVPCNLKKEILKMVIKAKLSGHYEEVELLLKKVREVRLLRRKQRSKALEKSRAMEKTELVEENNNEMKSEEGQETLRHSKVRELLHNMVKMSSAPNVTIQQTSTHTRYRALINPGPWRFNNCMGVSQCTSIAQQKPETVSCNPTVIKYATSNTASVATDQDSCQASTSTATEPTVVANQWNNPQFNYSKNNNGHSYATGTAVSVRETLLQQYHRNPVSYEPAQRITNNKSWTGGVLCHRPNIVATGYQPLPNFHTLPYNNQVCKNIQSYNNSQLYNPDPQPSEIGCCQSKPTSNSYQASQQQYDRTYYGGFQHGIQRTSTPFNIYDNFVGTQNAKVSSTNVEPYAGLQQAFPGYNRDPINDDPYENQVPPYEVITEKVSPNIIDVSKMPAECENNVDTDLGMLANLAMIKTQQVIDNTRSHQYNNGLLMINGSSSELMACDYKPPMQDIPTWNDFLDQMSNNLSPGVTNKKAVVQCKYGCHTPTTNRRQQLDHEAQCYQQPMQCPLTACTYVGQLRSITLHILNDHNNDIRSNGNGTFFIDFTDGKCSFEQSSSLLRNCPKKFCFPQLVDGRLFLIKVIGNFDSMQVVVYVQYVNDYYNWKSQVACEVLRQDGVPYQYKGDVHPLTYNPLHIISRRSCLIFNMNINDWDQNLFLLHTKIHNCKI